MDFAPHTPEDLIAMLAAVGRRDLDELFAHIPPKLLAQRHLDLPDGRSEDEVLTALTARAAANDTAAVCFAGGGAYDHYVPAVVGAITARGELLTAYTPYQPEVSQGMLQALFEYQTAISELTGLPVSNASLYDGGSAVAEAVSMACAATRRNAVVVSGALDAPTRQVVRTYGHPLRRDVRVTAYGDDGRTPVADVAGDVAAVVVAQPNALGVVEDVRAHADAAHAAGAKLIVKLEPTAVGLIATPGSLGADLVVGEGQPLGQELTYGGPSFGFLACATDQVRRIPGRIVGATVDARGSRGYVSDAARARRAGHPPREGDVEHLHQPDAVRAGRAGVPDVAGAAGLRELATACLARARHAAARLTEVDGVELAVSGPYLKEFALRLDVADPPPPSPRAPRRRLPRRAGRARRCRGGCRHGRRHRAADRRRGRRPGRHARAGREGAALMPVMGDRTAEEPTAFERSSPGRRSATLPRLDVPAVDPADALPGVELATQPPALPELGELDLVRHFTRLSHRNHGIDVGFYPLGSCSMKYNPRLAETAAALPGFRHLHPWTPDAAAQGTLALLYDLERWLAELTGLHAATFQPAAGAHGELTGLMLMRAYHEEHGDARRTIVVPDSAHGTNPASAAMCGYDVVTVPSGRDGLVDVDALEALVDESTAGLMLTNPNTLGLFELDIERIAAALHRVGALLYYDGANFNAICARVRPGDMGFDVVHLNVHKTFATPHGGGGPVPDPWSSANALRRTCPRRSSCATTATPGRATAGTMTDHARSAGSPASTATSAS